MTELNQIYKCKICGNIVEILHTGAGSLACCNQSMALIIENSEEASHEKHIPILERDGDAVTVTVGSAIHPMEEKHSIEWIEVISGNDVKRQVLKPGDKPEVKFCSDKNPEIKTRAYCNLHGLWLSKG